MLTFLYRSTDRAVLPGPCALSPPTHHFASLLRKHAFCALAFLAVFSLSFIAQPFGAYAAEPLDKRFQVLNSNENAAPLPAKKKASPPATKEPKARKEPAESAKDKEATTYSLAPLESELDGPATAPPPVSPPAPWSATGKSPAPAPTSTPAAVGTRAPAPLKLPITPLKKESLRGLLDKDAATVIEEPKTPRVFTMPDRPLSFDDCVNLALQQSPYFVQSAMEIKLKQIDESDSWYKLLPNIEVRTGYVITSTHSTNNPYILNFSTGNWDPISAGFSIKAAKLVTEIAILGHLKTISAGLENIGNLFLELSAFEQMAAHQEELVSIAQQEKNYLTNLLNTGGANALEIRIAEQQLEIAKLERNKIEADRHDRVDKMKTFIGLDLNCNLILNFKRTREQLLNGFDPGKSTLADVQSNSLDLIIQRHLIVMQEYNIKLAYARFLPKLFVESRTADPGSDNQGLYSSVGFNWTIWDWGERNRNVTRSELQHERAKVKENVTSIELGTQFRSAMALYGRTHASVKLAQAQVELANLRKQQSEINYQGGSQPFPVFLQQIREYFVAKKSSLIKEMENVRSGFAIRHLAGDLYNTYIDAKAYTTKPPKPAQ